MKYELALKLKKAGFPPTKSGKVVMSETQEKLFLHGAKVIEEGKCDVPNLSELIHACGKEFESLEKYNGTWVATAPFLEVSGDTQSEAVANLWLALNNK